MEGGRAVLVSLKKKKQEINIEKIVAQKSVLFLSDSYEKFLI